MTALSAHRSKEHHEDHKSTMHVKKPSQRRSHFKTKSSKRKAAAKDKKTIEDEADAIFKKYDKEGDGMLDRQEMLPLLTELNKGTAPTTEEVDMLLRTMDNHLGDPTGDVEGGEKRARKLADGGRCRPDELKETMVMWKQYNTLCSLVVGKLDTAGYSATSAEHLPKEKLKALLVELNESEEVSDEEVQEVMKLAGLSGEGKRAVSEYHIDLVMGVVNWYAHVDHEDEAAPQAPSSGGASKSSCCIVS